MKEECASCVFFVGEDRGICIRKRPVVTKDEGGKAIWQPVSKYSWCGEYQLKPTKAEAVAIFEASVKNYRVTDNPRSAEDIHD